jgi:hypothetical protein
MEVTLLRVPVVCPECENEVLAEFPIAPIAKALTYGRSIRLIAPCHDKAWVASELEREQLRQYLEAAKNGRAQPTRLKIVDAERSVPGLPGARPD